MNIASILEKAAFYFPDYLAVIDKEKSIRFNQFNRDASRVASALHRRGIRPGDHVALCAPNSYAWLAFYFGVLRAGAVAVTFSHLLTKNELVKILLDCKPKALLTTDQKLADLSEIQKQAQPGLIIAENGDISFGRLAAEGIPGSQIVDRDRQDTAAILYTGGTTGTPKGAMLSHGNLQTSTFNVAHYERSTENDRALCFLPLNHVFAQVHVMNSMIFCGGGLVMQPGFNLDSVLDAIRRWKVTKCRKNSLPSRNSQKVTPASCSNVL